MGPQQQQQQQQEGEGRGEEGGKEINVKAHPQAINPEHNDAAQR